MKKIITLAFASMMQLANAQLTNGLQACYPLDCDHAVNGAATGSPLNGTTSNVSCVTGHTGLSNTAYSFAGNTNSYIDLPSDYRIKGDTVCFSGWFYPDSLPAEQYLVYTQNTCSYNFEAYSLITYYDASISKYVFRVSKSGASCNYAPQMQSTTIFPSVGRWYHVVFYIDNSKMWLYINNTLQASNTISVPFSYNSGGMKVVLSGTHISYFDLPYKGRMDDLRFYNRELTATEIATLFQRSPACDVKKRPTGISETTLNNSDYLVYPNPGNGKFFVDAEAGTSFRVYDINGKTVAHKATEVGQTIQLELLSTTPGFYFVDLFDINGRYLQTKKIAVNN